MLKQLEHYFGPHVVQGLRAAPLGDHLDSFVATLAEAGYSRTTVQIRLRLLAQLGMWLRRTQRTAADVDQSMVEAFLKAYHCRLQAKKGDRATLRDFIVHLQHQGITTVCPATRPVESPLRELVQHYESYLQNERGLTAATVERYSWFIRRFILQRFHNQPLTLSAINATDVSSFIIKHTHSISPKRAQLMVTALRSFFRFLVREGETLIDLAACVPTVPCRSQSTVPRYISEREVQQLLTSCDGSTPAGRRNYAILVLLARLGLRAGEVAGLQLEDIDWRCGEIRVFGKGQVRDRLPLVREVGKALVSYLHDRPGSTSRRVFLRLKAPYRGLSTSAPVSQMVRRALFRAGLRPPFTGAHLLRHSLATSLLRQGASMTEIAELLRHRSFATTEIYAKVDSRSLRALAQPWPQGGGGR
jgi:site-specific recombinase XerD